MIGERYWTTGIVLTPSGVRWAAALDFLDGGFCDENSTEGTLRCRYLVADAVQAATVLVADAARLGVEFRDPQVYVHGDAENTNGWPENWQQTVRQVADVLGWPAPSFISDDTPVQ